jgi:hypothetical protein
VLLGLPGDATYANYREANRALWNQSIIPLARKILDALAQGLRPYFDGLTLDLDLDAIPALAEDRERLWAQVGAADFLTTAEKRAAVGLAPVAQPSEISNEAGALEFKFNPWHDTENGHFIAREFGGPEISYNHFAQNARFNLSEYRIIENKWKKALKAGKNVTVDIQATYTSNSRRPDWIFVFSNIEGIDEIDRMPNKK